MVPSEMVEEDDLLQQELTEVKKRLVESETARAQAVREFANIKYLLNQILLVEHFAVFDEVAAPLPPNWSHELVHCMEIQASHSKFASQLDYQAEQEIADLEAARGLTASELARAKDDIHILQTDLQSHKTSSQHEIAALRKENATAKQEIHKLQTNLEQVQGQYDSTKNQIQNLEAACQAYSSELSHVKTELSQVKTELSRYHEDLVIAQNQNSKAYAEVTNLKTETVALAVELKLLQATLASSQENVSKLREDLDLAEVNLECLTGDAAALRTELRSIKSAGAQKIESLNLQLLESESRNWQLQRARIEMAIAKEALKSWISSSDAALQLPYNCLISSLPHTSSRKCVVFHSPFRGGSVEIVNGS